MSAFHATALAAVVWFASGAAAFGAEHTVEMLNKGADGERMVFVPSVIHAEPGDTIRFISTDKSHNSESIKGAIPEGAEPWKTKLNKDAEITVSAPGIYAYKCSPHFGMGMVGVIVVGGSTENLEEVSKTRYPGKAKQRMAAILEEIGQ